MIRVPTIDDLDELRKIHEQYFVDEFSFTDFLHASMASFVIIDDSDGQIITAGSIRPIVEMVAVTNLAKSPRMRRSALLDMLQVANFFLRDTNMHQIHVFVQSDSWEQQLIKAGFSRTKGNALYINIENGFVGDKQNGKR